MSLSLTSERETTDASEETALRRTRVRTVAKLAVTVVAAREDDALVALLLDGADLAL